MLGGVSSLLKMALGVQFELVVAWEATLGRARAFTLDCEQP